MNDDEQFWMDDLMDKMSSPACMIPEVDQEFINEIAGNDFIEDDERERLVDIWSRVA